MKQTTYLSLLAFVARADDCRLSQFRIAGQRLRQSQDGKKEIWGRSKRSTAKAPFEFDITCQKPGTFHSKAMTISCADRV